MIWTPGISEEDADEQADGDAARHRAAGEAPELAVQDALAERLHPAALRQLLAVRHVRARDPAASSQIDRSRRSAMLPQQAALLALPVLFLLILALVVRLAAPASASSTFARPRLLK